MVVVMGVLVVVLVVFAATTEFQPGTLNASLVRLRLAASPLGIWRLNPKLWRWEFRLAVLMKSIALPTACCLWRRCRPWHEPFHLAASSSFNQGLAEFPPFSPFFPQAAGLVS